MLVTLLFKFSPLQYNCKADHECLHLKLDYLLSGDIFKLLYGLCVCTGR